MLCRLIFRRHDGELLVRSLSSSSDYPTVDEDIKTFSALNGYNENALSIIDIFEGDLEFENATTAETIKLKNGNLVYIFPSIEPEPPTEPNPVSELSDKLDLLIQMQLEREGII